MKYGVSYDVPSTFTTILYFYMNIFVFGALTWYFDHVDISNRGKTYEYLFFLKKDYWCPSKRIKSNINRFNELNQIYSETLDEKNKIEELRRTNSLNTGKLRLYISS